MRVRMRVCDGVGVGGGGIVCMPFSAHLEHFRQKISNHSHCVKPTIVIQKHLCGHCFSLSSFVQMFQVS